MSDVRELARECLRLYAFISPVMHDALHDVVDGVSDHGHIIGAVRHAVEVECERRVLHYQWGSMALEGGALWHYCLIGGISGQETGGSAALECALQALKWLLENPVEVSDGLQA